MKQASLTTAYLPSEVARLVLGYLKDQQCTDAAESFLQESPHLLEYRRMLEEGFSAPLTISGKNLTQILSSCKSDDAISASDKKEQSELWVKLDHILTQIKSFQSTASTELPVQPHVPLHTAAKSDIQRKPSNVLQIIQTGISAAPVISQVKPTKIGTSTSHNTTSTELIDSQYQKTKRHVSWQLPTKSSSQPVIQAVTTESPPTSDVCYSDVTVTKKASKVEPVTPDIHRSPVTGGASSVLKNRRLFPKRPSATSSSASDSTTDTSKLPVVEITDWTELSTETSTAQPPVGVPHSSKAFTLSTLSLPEEQWNWSPYKHLSTDATAHSSNQKAALVIETPEKEAIDVDINDLLNELFPMKNVVEKLVDNQTWTEEFAKTINERKADQAHLAEEKVPEILNITKDDPTFSDFHSLLEGKSKRKGRPTKRTIEEAMNLNKVVTSVNQSLATSTVSTLQVPVTSSGQLPSSSQPEIVSSGVRSGRNVFSLGGKVQANSLYSQAPSENQQKLDATITVQSAKVAPCVTSCTDITNMQPQSGIQVSSTTAQSIADSLLSPKAAPLETPSKQHIDLHGLSIEQTTELLFGTSSTSRTPAKSRKQLNAGKFFTPQASISSSRQMKSKKTSLSEPKVPPMAKDEADPACLLTAKWSPSLRNLIKQVSPNKSAGRSRTDHVRTLSFSPKGQGCAGALRRSPRRGAAKQPLQPVIAERSPDLNSPQLQIDLNSGGCTPSPTGCAGAITTPPSVGNVSVQSPAISTHQPFTRYAPASHRTSHVMSPLAAKSQQDSHESTAPSTSSRDVQVRRSPRNTRHSPEGNKPVVGARRRVPVAMKGSKSTLTTNKSRDTGNKKGSPCIVTAAQDSAGSKSSITSITVAQSTPKGKNSVPTMISTPDLNRAVSIILEHSSEELLSALETTPGKDELILPSADFTSPGVSGAVEFCESEAVDVAQALVELASTESPLHTPVKCQSVDDYISDSTLMPPPAQPSVAPKSTEKRSMRKRTSSAASNQTVPAPNKKLKKASSKKVSDKLKKMTVQSMLDLIHKK